MLLFAFSLNDLSNQMYLILGHSFRLFMALLLIYVYSTIDLIINDRRIIRAKNMWLVVGYFNFFSPLLSIGNVLTLWDISDTLITLFNALSLIFVLYVSIFIPEGILISHVQFKRIFNLYEKLVDLKHHKIEEYPVSSLKAYIDKVKEFIEVEN